MQYPLASGLYLKRCDVYTKENRDCTVPSDGNILHASCIYDPDIFDIFGSSWITT